MPRLPNKKMSKLQLFPGPRLVSETWVYDDDAGTGDWISTDVTDRAHEFLFREVVADPDVTLADVLRLVTDAAVMQAVFRQDFVSELCAEVSKGPVEKDDEAWEKIEYLELYQVWNHNTSTHTYADVGRFRLHGMGIVQKEDIFEHGHLMYKKGERIQWSVSLSPVRELLHLPVRIQRDVLICEDDIDAKMYCHTLQIAKSESITLGSLIQRILWELSWHGTPEDSEKISLSLKEQMDEIDAGTVKTAPYEHRSESLGFISKKVVYDKFFVDSNAIEPDEVYRALRALEDVELAQEGLKRLLDGKLQVRHEFSALTGRELRKAVREAQHGKDD